MAVVFRFPHIVSAIARKPEAIWWAERSPSGFSKRAVFSRAQRIRLRTVISFPHGSTRVQILASWFVSKRPAIRDCWAIAVPSARLAVCPAAESLALDSSFQWFEIPACVTFFHSAEHSLEHVTVLVLAGEANSLPQMGQTFQFRPAYFGAQSGQH